MNNLGNPILLITGISVAFIAALWLSLVIWTFQDISRRSRDTFARILATLIVLLLFFPGFMLYLILRPQRTIEENYQKALEEEALLQSLEEINICHHCHKPVKPHWKFCPSCQNQIKIECEQCHELLDPNWAICPACGNKQEPTGIDDVLNLSLTPDESNERVEILPDDTTPTMTDPSETQPDDLPRDGDYQDLLVEDTTH